ncbi:acyltransferase family protein [Floccifex sp.]|uniref:acyltransferase family protein n=1 Tax=Floccifex sp. TaxID=2815810 RepID=UPI003F0CA3F6
MKKRRIKGIDGIRAIAIIGITGFHFFPDIFKGGYLGVCLFFIVSGFLLMQQEKENFSLFSFYKKRIKRLYPSLLFMMAITLSIYFIVDASLLDGMKSEVLSIVLGYNNIWQIIQNADYFTRILNASCFTSLWFLSLEMQIYLIWPFLYLGIQFLLNKTNRKTTIRFLSFLTLLSGIWMMICLSQGITRVYYGLDTRIFSFLMGCTLALFLKEYPRRQNKIQGYVSSAAFVLFFIFVSLTMDGESKWIYLGGMWIVSFLFTVFLYFLIQSPCKWLETPVLKIIGKISYEIYLWQYPIIFLCQRLRFSYISIQLFILFVLSIFTYLFVRQKNKIQLLLVYSISFGISGYGLIQSKDKKEDIEELKTEMESNKEQMIEDQKNISSADIVMVGDSVLLGSYDEIKQVYPDCLIDAEVSRHMGQEKEALLQFEANGQLKDVVVIAMGTNGLIYDFLAVDVLDYLKDKDVYWVNNYCPTLSWQDTNNAYLLELEKQYSNLHIIDWYTQASNHPEYLSSDGIHPSVEGAKVYAELIQQAIEGDNS